MRYPESVGPGDIGGNQAVGFRGDGGGVEEVDQPDTFVAEADVALGGPIGAVKISGDCELLDVGESEHALHVGPGFARLRGPLGFGGIVDHFDDGFAVDVDDGGGVDSTGAGDLAEGGFVGFGAAEAVGGSGSADARWAASISAPDGDEDVVVDGDGGDGRGVIGLGGGRGIADFFCGDSFAAETIGSDFGEEG